MKSRLERLADEKERLQTELIQVHSMLLQTEELIVDELLKSVKNLNRPRKQLFPRP
ncbi:MAG: hypothetical protein IBX68_02900 [Dehalococcoidia bacterium]|nr:hypothetical protein [Dehalococcoidia bacterium]